MFFSRSSILYVAVTQNKWRYMTTSLLTQQSIDHDTITTHLTIQWPWPHHYWLNNPVTINPTLIPLLTHSRTHPWHHLYSLNNRLENFLAFSPGCGIYGRWCSPGSRFLEGMVRVCVSVSASASVSVSVIVGVSVSVSVIVSGSVNVSVSVSISVSILVDVKNKWQKI